MNTNVGGLSVQIVVGQALGKFTEACSKYSYSFDYATLPIINKKQPI